MLHESVVLRVVDDQGHPLFGVDVAFEVQGGGGQFTPNVVRSDAQGLASSHWTLGTTAGETQSARASLSGVPSIGVSIEATARSGTPAALAMIVPFSAANRAGESVAEPAPSVVVVDRFGNDTHSADVAITAAVDPSDGAHSILRGALEVTGSGGVATFRNLAIAGTAGPVKVAFSSGSLSVSSTATLIGGTPATLQATGGVIVDGTVALPVPPLSVIVRDAYGNGVAGAAVAFTAPGAPSAYVTSDASGTATYTAWTLPQQTGAYQVVATGVGLGSVTFTVRAHAASPARLELLSDQKMVTGPGLPGPDIRVRTTDAFGNPTSGIAVRFTLNDASMLGDALTVADGVATFTSWVVPATVGAYVINATVGSLAAVRVDLTVQPLLHIQFVNFPNLNLTSSSIVTVQATDGSGAGIFGAAVNWSVLSGSAAFAPTLSTTSAGGVAMSTLAIGTVAGTVRIRASIGQAVRDTAITLPPLPFYSFDSAFTQVRLRVGTSLSRTVTARDILGNPIPDLVLTSRVVDTGLPGGTISPAKTATNALGSATFSIVIGPWAGPQYFSVETADGRAWEYLVTSFSDHGNLVAWHGPTSVKSGSLPPMFSVGLFHADGSPAVGEIVTWSVAPGNGTVFAGSAVASTPTSSSGPIDIFGSGLALWQVPTTPGTYHVTVTAPSNYVNNPVVFTVTVVP